jgi:signal transduction histidine kinase
VQTALIAVLLVERQRRRRAREALDRLNAELEERIAARTTALNEKSRELETFAYSVAHDLKAPLRGIDGYSRLLLEDHAAALNEEGRSFLETIHGSSEEMSQLIDDLLEYSRLERREFKPDRLDLGPLITLIVEQKKREATESAVDFVVNVNGGSVVADSNGLTQSLRNYLDNAVKFSSKVSQPRIEIGSRETINNLVVWIRDNGVGFDMKYHDRIFNIFQRLNPNEEYPGTGVGLAIVRKAMERMGGRAWGESQPGEGATFYLEIPK